MKDFLKKIKIIQYLTLSLEMDQNEFVDCLRQNIDQGSTGGFADSFDVFSSSKNEYKGAVGLDTFEIKKKRRFFDNTGSLAKATGTISKERKSITINVEINGLSTMMTIFFVIITIFYVLFIVIAFVLPMVSSGIVAFIIPFIFIHALFMIGLPYLMMRRSVKRLKHDLERDFFFFTKKHTNTNEIQ
jgi:hypothetical protein